MPVALMVTVLLLSTLALMLLNRTRDSILILVVQGLALGGIAAVAGALEHAPHLIGVALIAVLVKALAIPLVLARIMQQLGVALEVERLLTTKTSALVSVGLIMLAYYVTEPLRLPGGSLASLSLPVAIAMILLGAFAMLTRRRAMSQMVGLIVVENGLSLAALALVSQMPLIVDLALSFDALMGVLIMSLFVQRIHAEFRSSDTKPLQKLRG